MTEASALSPVVLRPARRGRPFSFTRVEAVLSFRHVRSAFPRSSGQRARRNFSTASSSSPRPVAGRGSQFDITYDVCTTPDCPGPDVSPQDGTPDNRRSTVATTLNGVQEPAAISASPFFELRFVYLFWAP